MILTAQLYCSAHEIGISAVSPSPQRVADYDHIVRTWRFLLRSESPAERGGNSEQLKEVRRDARASYSLRLAVPGQIPSACLQCGDRRKCSVRFTPFEIILDAPGKARAPLPSEDDLDGVDPFRFGIRKRFQQGSVDDAEYRGVRADAQRQRERGRGGEAGSSEQHPRAVTQVLPEV